VKAHTIDNNTQIEKLVYHAREMRRSQAESER
jgi:hypothetical protein